MSERRERIEALGYRYGDQPKRAVSACNLCGGSRFVGLTHRDRYGFDAAANGCQRCGLVFLNPVMTPDAYLQFYRDVYRPLVSAYHGRRIDAKSIQAEQREYAADRTRLLEPFLQPERHQTLLDVGGATGVVAHAFAKRFRLRGTVLDPAPLELEEARSLGLETIAGLVEQFDPGTRRFDVVLMCQTVDHLLDVAGTLAAIRELLPPEGILFVDIVDFRAAYLRQWSVEGAIKIDHPYYLTVDTMPSYLARAGFEILHVDCAADHLHVGYVCRPGAASAMLPSSEAVAGQWREVRYVQNAPAPGPAR